MLNDWSKSEITIAVLTGVFIILASAESAAYGTPLLPTMLLALILQQVTLHRL